MSDKLPEWPIAPTHRAQAHVQAAYYLELADAALARMEALMQYAEHTSGWRHGCASLGENTLAYRNNGLRGCTCGLSELLAACERRKS